MTPEIISLANKYSTLNKDWSIECSSPFNISIIKVANDARAAIIANAQAGNDPAFFQAVDDTARDLYISHRTAMVYVAQERLTDIVIQLNKSELESELKTT